MNEIQVFESPVFGRIDCYEDDGMIYLNLEQSAKGLGFTQTISGNKYVRWERVDKYLNKFNFPTRGERPAYIPENVFYRLAMKANNEAAEAFQEWIADEVIPCIRKNGLYVNPKHSNPQDAFAQALADPRNAARLLIELADERDRNAVLEKENEAQAKQIEIMEPKAFFADSVANSKDGILVRELAKILTQNGYKTGEKRLFAWLRDNGYLIKSNGRDKNQPTQWALDKGLFTVKEGTRTSASGNTYTYTTTLVTGYGQQYFVNLLCPKRELVHA